MLLLPAEHAYQFTVWMEPLVFVLVVLQELSMLSLVMNLLTWAVKFALTAWSDNTLQLIAHNWPIASAEIAVISDVRQLALIHVAHAILITIELMAINLVQPLAQPARCAMLLNMRRRLAILLVIVFVNCVLISSV
jgi:hypothetical protein